MFCNNLFYPECTCTPTCTTTCGPTVEITCSDCCTRVCSQVTYTITITNTATCTIECARLHVRLPRSVCFNSGTVTLNTVAQADATPADIEIGSIAPSATTTITFVVTVMECKRYNLTRAFLTGVVCCCCTAKKLVIPSNVSCLQVCCCCAPQN